MRFIEIDPTICEPFKRSMLETGWELTHQDVGQTELIAYGYIMVWEKDNSKVTLNYNDRQGVCKANLEILGSAYDEMQTLIESL